MRALFIGSYPNAVEPIRNIFFKKLIYEMAHQGVECTVVSPVSYTYYKGKTVLIDEYLEEKTETGETVQVYHPRMISYSAKKIGRWNTVHLTQRASQNAVLRICRKIDMKKFDFVYGHFFLGGGLTASVVAQKYNLPAYIAYGECDFHSEISSKFGDLTSKHVRNVEGIICVSSANLTDMKQREFSKNIPLFLSLNAIDKTAFYKRDKANCRNLLGLSQDDFIVGFAGYFIERKGPDRVLAACKDIDNVKLAFAGTGNMSLESEKIVFKRELKHHEMPIFLNAVDVFVLPTRNEGCCNAILEAMACGCPIVSSDRPFNYDVLTDENSILVDPDDVEEIKKAVIKIKKDDLLRKKMSTASLNIVSALTIEKRVENILNFIYNKV